MVLLGTLYPLILDALGGGKVSVGPPFFEATFIPIAVPLLIACAMGAMMAWKRGDLAGVLGRLKIAVALAAIVMAVAAWRAGIEDILAAFGLGVAAWLFAGAMVELAEKIGLFRLRPAESLRRAARLPRAAWGMTIAHAGLGIIVAGMVAANAWQTERIQAMRPGESVDLAGYTVVFEGAGRTRGPNYDAVTGRFQLLDGAAPVALMRPERRNYPAERSQTTEAAIHTTWLADIYVVLGEQAENGTWAVRMYHNPLVPWIWAGAIVMAAGGLVSLTDRRLRVGAPRKARAPAPAPAQSEGRAPMRPAPFCRRGYLRYGGRVRRLPLSGGRRRKNIAEIPSVLIDKPAPALDLPPIEGPHRRARIRAAQRLGLAGQRLRVVVPALPNRASAADAPGA